MLVGWVYLAGQCSSIEMMCHLIKVSGGRAKLCVCTHIYRRRCALWKFVPKYPPAYQRADADAASISMLHNFCRLAWGKTCRVKHHPIFGISIHLLVYVLIFFRPQGVKIKRRSPASTTFMWVDVGERHGLLSTRTRTRAHSDVRLRRRAKHTRSARKVHYFAGSVIFVVSFSACATAGLTPHSSRLNFQISFCAKSAGLGVFWESL